MPALNFYMESSTDGASPASDTPAVLIYTPGAGAWAAPTGAVAPLGDGWWSLTPSDQDAAGGAPLLLYATADDAVPTPGAYDPAAADGVLRWAAGGSGPAIPIWLGTAASNGYQPATGLSPSVLLAAGGAAMAAAAGSVAEPVGPGLGKGFYLYTPAPADLATPGPLLIEATAPGALTQTMDLLVDASAAPAAPPITWPAPAPIAQGTPLSGAQLAATSTVAGTFTYAPPAGAILPGGPNTLSAVFVPTNLAAYLPAVATASLTVIPAPTPTPTPSPAPSPTPTPAPTAPAIAWPSPSPIEAGTPLSSAQLDATASAPGSIAYAPPPGTVLPAGEYQLAAVYTPTDPTAYQAAIAYAALTVTPSPTPAPTPTASPAAAAPDPTLCLFDPDACTLVTPGPCGTTQAPPRATIPAGDAADLVVQCRYRGTGAPGAFGASDTFSAAVVQGAATATIGPAAPVASVYAPPGGQPDPSTGLLRISLTNAIGAALQATIVYTVRAWRTIAATGATEEIARIRLTIEPPAFS